ncbi:MAG: response regulator [Caldithrix sp.]|nr:response regulator [Caldithrix sp.]
MFLPTDILLIDDSTDHLILSKQLLQNNGFRVRSVHNPENALQLASTYQPKLIILDIMMPKIDGFAILKKIKENTKTQKIPVIVLTGKTFPPDRKKAFALGANAFLSKPITTGSLIEAIQQQMRN